MKVERNKEEEKSGKLGIIERLLGKGLERSEGTSSIAQ